MRLSVNNTGAWKTVLNFDEHRIDDVKRAVIDLLHCIEDQRCVWKLSRDSQVHPGGETVCITRGYVAATARWTIAPCWTNNTEDE